MKLSPEAKRNQVMDDHIAGDGLNLPLMPLASLLVLLAFI